MKHDFCDGQGLVPAHRHVNGGGWVADSAWVDKEAYVGVHARVFGLAKVIGPARLHNFASVFGNVQVCCNSEIFDYARIFGNAVVCNGCVTGFAVVCNNRVVVDTTVGMTIQDVSDGLLNLLVMLSAQPSESC